MDPIKDKKGGKKETVTEYSKNLQYFMEEFSLVDIWRLRNKNATLFTRQERCCNGIVQSRLDYWIVSKAMVYQTRDITIKPGY